MSNKSQRYIALAAVSGALLVAGCTTATTANSGHDHAAHQAQARAAGAPQAGHGAMGKGMMAGAGGMEMCPMHGEMHGKMQGEMHGKMHGQMHEKMHGQMHGAKPDGKAPVDRRAMIEQHMMSKSPEQRAQMVRMMENRMTMMQQDLQIMREQMGKPAPAK
ncbi:hypothetical protein [Lacisediminimonas sp.]|uniref:hypothetical protein n=1 Tax=Lacisediminimonas sp. TaxID=3060582 RepID=UPI0027225531|nr:hypothetical protein [Lacisediminimonas sp.]MDO8299982.1 hypothetical protein [Lacisediminimonas sp.]